MHKEEQEMLQNAFGGSPLIHSTTRAKAESTSSIFVRGSSRSTTLSISPKAYSLKLSVKAMLNGVRISTLRCSKLKAKPFATVLGMSRLNYMWKISGISRCLYPVS